MIQLDVPRFRAALVKAIADAFAEAKTTLANQTLYGFSLYVERLGSVVLAVAQSEEGLRTYASKTAQSGEWSCDDDELVSLIAQRDRWECFEDWFTCAELHFHEVNRLLDESYGSDADAFFAQGTTRLVKLLCLASLAELDALGVFGSGADRDSIVLGLYHGDQSDEDLLGWAEQVNPFEVFNRYRAELADQHVVSKRIRWLG